MKGTTYRSGNWEEKRVRGVGKVTEFILELGGWGGRELLGRAGRRDNTLGRVIFYP